MSMIQNISIFYFSGTGNSKKIALWFSEFAIDKGISCEIVAISTINSSLQKSNPNNLILIISPVHGFNFPKITLDFIRALPNGTNRVVLMNTRGSAKIGNRITPGLTGVAFMFSSLILKRKGYKIIGQIPFDMPSNWISIHPAINGNSAQFIFDKNYFRAKKHFENIYKGKNDFASRKDIIQDVFISPVAIAYYLIGRFFLAKSYYASYKCTNCNLCIKQCPVKAIKKVNKRPFWTFKCESCMKCMNRCPVRAIEAPHGLWIIVSYLASVTSTLIVSWLLTDVSLPWVVTFILFNILLMAFLYCLYRLQQLGLKNNLFSKLLSLLSLTRYQWWGRYTSALKKQNN